jgi:anthranilate phosphoribosyltransferase
VSGAVLGRLLDRRSLSDEEAREVFDALLAPGTTDAERGGILVALAGREEDAGELAAFAREMRRRATPFAVPEEDAPIDLCGSGGAPTPSFNVSTVSAFLLAAAGVPVVKHGNRSASGLCGSSDLLEALGLPVTTSVEYARATYRARRLAFLHAPLYHPATKAVATVRRALGIPTIFNRLGPLSNPARVPYQLAGAPSPAVARTFADVLARLEVQRGVAMASDDGCDEFSPQARTTAYVWGPTGQSVRIVRPEAHLTRDERQGSWSPLPPPEAATETERILKGGDGARRGAVILTGGTALWLTGRSPTFSEGVERARETLDSGEGAEVLGELREVAARYRPRGA